MTKKQLVTLKKRRYALMNILYASTGIPFNALDKEIGNLMDYCLEHKYNDRCALGALFTRLWKNHCDGLEETLV